MTLTLVAKRSEGRGVLSFVFRNDTRLHWGAGQFLQYSLPHPHSDERGITRYFTIASAPFERDIMLTTRFARGRSSTFKRVLCELPLGAGVEAGVPEGDFVIDDPLREHVLIAGGIGITPFRAMLLDLDQRQIPINATLLYANRTPEFVYKAELDRLIGRHPNLVIHYVVFPPRLTETSIRAVVGDLAKPIYYISGPEGFVEAFGTKLSALGVADAQIRRDYFPGYSRIIESVS